MDIAQYSRCPLQYSTFLCNRENPNKKLPVWPSFSKSKSTPDITYVQDYSHWIWHLLHIWLRIPPIFCQTQRRHGASKPKHRYIYTFNPCHLRKQYHTTHSLSNKLNTVSISCMWSLAHEFQFLSQLPCSHFINKLDADYIQSVRTLTPQLHGGSYHLMGDTVTRARIKHRMNKRNRNIGFGTST